MLRFIALAFLLTGCAAMNISPYNGSQYLGTKYMRDPLGEEKAPDTDPLIRTDAFDCTTFVETVMARADVDTLNKIRYKNGKIDFLNRNHFIETDWLNNNADRVQNASAKYGTTRKRNLTIDKSGWLKKTHKINADFAPETVSLEYIPYKNLGAIENSETLIVLFISANSKSRDSIGTDLAVTHMGLLLPGGTTLRHASSAAGHVVDADFVKYASRRQGLGEMGVALIEIKK